MRVAVLGTGMVGRAIAGKLSELGHEVVVGTRDPVTTLARQEPDFYGNPPFAAWQAEHPAVRLADLADAAAHGELVVNATAGGAALEALRLAGAGNLDGKVLVDVANPLDFSQGMPPSLSVVNTDSLGECIQREFPSARVVKTLNTVNASLMVNPGIVGGATTPCSSAATTPRPRRWSPACSPRGSAGGTSSTLATSPPPAAPRCCWRCGCG
jgi:predicted dinucleotide-binding enzyme